MKAIIKGLLYDTDNSELVFNDKNHNRLYYKTKNGRYFCKYRTGAIAEKSEDSIKELLGMYDYEKYLELFDAPEEA